MPASKRLQQEFSGQPVSFLYLSLDENAEQWRRAALKEGMQAEGVLSFLLLQARSSSLLQALEVRSIPRYLLYDERGRLLEAHAPGPEGPAIRSLLRQQLQGLE
ncbi:hypothetical protein ADICEAN_01856 [Cesiribacter andamanensis AMV16]|uniref:Uncharacterized protein n=2 Tax=Cesiribacter TaxID=1133570 RepID=M7N6U9_9BACT|nr:hypothetical protein ADICEAN_01856 [Cesiribacter andamanensis AMV16]